RSRMRDTGGETDSPGARAVAAADAEESDRTIARPSSTPRPAPTVRTTIHVAISSHRIRRMGPSTWSAGSPSATISPVVGERLNAEYDGRPSREIALKLASLVS